ncbi:MAG: hypothetical protein D6808_04025 [Candidatus Dadabacteria bacterium]|nr:MAG: hypothetical protein D6808_04025 [Candidatus Dadabacteria bacterium]
MILHNSGSPLIPNRQLFAPPPTLPTLYNGNFLINSHEGEKLSLRPIHNQVFMAYNRKEMIKTILKSALLLCSILWLLEYNYTYLTSRSALQERYEEWFRNYSPKYSAERISPSKDKLIVVFRGRKIIFRPSQEPSSKAKYIHLLKLLKEAKLFNGDCSNQLLPQGVKLGVYSEKAVFSCLLDINRINSNPAAMLFFKLIEIYGKASYPEAVASSNSKSEGSEQL